MSSSSRAGAIAIALSGTLLPTIASATTVLPTFSRVAVDTNGTTFGPKKIGKNTGAGVMDTNLSYRVIGEEVYFVMCYTRSATTPNRNNSYMQGGLQLARLTDHGVEFGTPVELPVLDGERAWQRCHADLTDDAGFVLTTAASEDNGVNNNPQPVAFVLKRTGLDLALVKIPNSTRTSIDKPTNLIQTALAQGITVPNPNDQRGLHSSVETRDDTWAYGMQYNNQAHEGISVSVAADASIKVNWLKRYSDHAQHCRPRVAYDAKHDIIMSAAVEADNQPAEIGFRIAIIDPVTGDAKPNLNKVVYKSDPKNNKYVSEPSCGFADRADSDPNAPASIMCGFAMTSKARDRNGNNGHAGGGQVPNALLISAADLKTVGSPLPAAAPYGRHAHMFLTNYGDSGGVAAMYVGGSSTGGGAGKMQTITFNAPGEMAPLSSSQVYTVGTFSDVANLPARGKRNPNNQGKGFINGRPNVRNPGFGKPAGFMPEVKSFSAFALAGFSDAAAKDTGLRESLWFSLVPATWKEGLSTMPGDPTDKPGTLPDGLGPLPTVGEGSGPDGKGAKGDLLAGAEDSGCGVAPRTTALSAAWMILLGLVIRRMRGRR